MCYAGIVNSALLFITQGIRIAYAVKKNGMYLRSFPVPEVLRDDPELEKNKPHFHCLVSMFLLFMFCNSKFSLYIFISMIDILKQKQSSSSLSHL